MKSDLSIAIFCRYCNGLSSRYVKFLLDIEETCRHSTAALSFLPKKEAAQGNLLSADRNSSDLFHLRPIRRNKFSCDCDMERRSTDLQTIGLAGLEALEAYLQLIAVRPFHKGPGKAAPIRRDSSNGQTLPPFEIVLKFHLQQIVARLELRTLEDR